MVDVDRYGSPVWIGPLFMPTGFSDEGRGFVRALRRHGVELSALPVEREASQFLTQLADYPDEVIELNAAVNGSVARPTAAIVHTPLALCPPSPGDVPYAICRTMWETDGLPAESVDLLNTYDELWVPSQFNADTFAAAGIQVPISVIGEGVDARRFSPQTSPLHIPGRRSTAFLSIFEWSRRKGPDILLEAWANAFRPDDDVCLVLRAYPLGGFANDVDTQQQTDTLINHTLRSIGRRRDDVAPILVIGRHLRPSEIPMLYAAADCYVATSRGEGWGRPTMEAMATGLPVIAPEWGAPLAYLNHDNALLLRIDGLEEIDERCEITAFRGQRWAAPSASHLAELLHHVRADAADMSRLGRRARQDIEQSWQWATVARDAADRLEVVERERWTTPAYGAGCALVRSSTAVGTVVSRTHFPWARVLARSLSQQGIRLQVLVTDRGADDIQTSEPFDVLHPADITLSAEDFALMALIYTPSELACAMKPWLVSHLLQSNDAALYLDADINVYGSLETALALSHEHNLVLTPHLLKPLPRDGHTPTETDILGAGIFNLGFLGVGRGAESFLEFWKDRLRTDCLNDPGNMQCADQRWVDFAPAFFAHHIWRDPSVNVAYWNLHERALMRDEMGQYFVDGQPLTLFHFSGFDPLRPEQLSRHQGPRPRPPLGDQNAVAELFRAYRRQLLDAHYRRDAQQPYGFAALPSGETLTPERRRGYRNAILNSGTVENSPPTTPYDAYVEPLASSDPAMTIDITSIVEPPLVSIIIPTYNRRRLLQEALDTARAQRYPHIEILVLDDASTDDTPAYLRNLEAGDARLRVIRNERALGSLNNHRRGLALARGTHIKFLHDDDRLRPDAVQVLASALLTHPAASLASSQRTLIDDTGTPVQHQPPSLGTSSAELQGRDVGELMLLHATNLIGEPTTVLFRKDLLPPDSYASLGDRDYDWLSDVATWLQLLARGSLAYVGTVLSETRQHDGQLGRSLGEQRLQREWLSILEPARHLGYLSAATGYGQALGAVLPRLLAADLAGTPLQIDDTLSLLSDAITHYACIRSHAEPDKHAFSAPLLSN